MDRRPILVETEQRGDVFFAISDLFDVRLARQGPMRQCMTLLFDRLSEPRRGKGRQKPRFIFPLCNHNVDRVVRRDRSPCPREQAGSEGSWTLVIGIEKNEDDVRLSKQCQTYVMFHAPTTYAVVRDVDVSLSARPDWSGEIDFDVSVPPIPQPVSEQYRHGFHLAAAFHDRHDDILRHEPVRV